MKAVWNGAVLAESDQCVVIEGNQYFPPDSVSREYLVTSETAFTCPWKGVGTYYTLMVEGEEVKDGAWTYEQPPAAAIEQVGTDFTGYVGFWRGVEVVDNDHQVHHLTPGPLPNHHNS